MPACSLLESVQTFYSLDRKPHDPRRRSLAPKIDTPAARLRSPQISFRPDRRRDGRTRRAAAGDGVCYRVRTLATSGPVLRDCNGILDLRPGRLENTDWRAKRGLPRGGGGERSQHM